MGRLCKKAGKAIKRIIKGGADEIGKLLRELAGKIRQQRKIVGELEDKLKELDNAPDTDFNRRMRKIYEDLFDQEKKKLRDLEEEWKKLKELETTSSIQIEKVDDLTQALEANTGRWKNMMFNDAATEIVAILDATLGEQEKGFIAELTGDPCDDCLPFSFHEVDTVALADLLSDKGLDNWARTLCWPVPSQFPEQQTALAARVFYGAIAAGLDDMGLRHDLALQPVLRTSLHDMALEAIEKTAETPLLLLQQERAYQLRLPTRIREYALRQAPLPQQCPTPQEAAQSDAEMELRAKKAIILAARDRERNRFLLQGLLAVLGLDFLLEDEEDNDEIDTIINLLLAGLWLKAAVKFAALIWRLIRKPGLWAKLVRRYGRFGALRFLAGLGGRLVPAVLAGLIAYSWYEIYQEWQKRKGEWDRRLKELYDATAIDQVPNRDAIFMENMGYLPK